LQLPPRPRPIAKHTGLSEGGITLLENLLTVTNKRRVRSVVRSPLKTRQLALLVLLDDERSLARAAAAAGLTQPAASKLLRQLEDTLDVKLFERHARGMEPTRYGEILIRHARTALSGLGLAREEITALKSGLAGKVAIGAELSPGIHLLPMAIARVKQRSPAVFLSIDIEPSRPLIQRLLKGEFDMVVGRVPEVGHADELDYEPLDADEPHAIIAGAHHPLAGHEETDLEDLVDQPWILPPEGSVVRERLFATFRQRGRCLPTNIVETDSMPAITALLRQSHYVAALPERAAESCCGTGILTVLHRNLPLGLGGFGLMTRRQQKLSPGALLLFDTLRELAEQLYPPEGRPRGAARTTHA